MNVDKITPCQLIELKLSCFGCCGRDFTSKRRIYQDIKYNTQDFNQIKIPSTLRLLQFRDRLSTNPDDLMTSGICSNLVSFKGGILACPLHPKINQIIPKSKCFRLNKKDLRVNHCDIHCTCDSLDAWQTFSKKQKQKYIAWLKKQNFNHYNYSMGNINGTIIKDFFKFTKK